jgi:hypothetical protein
MSNSGPVYEPKPEGPETIEEQHSRWERDVIRNNPDCPAAFTYKKYPNKKDRCTKCGGHGDVPDHVGGFISKPCPECEGTGSRDHQLELTSEGAE